MTPAVDHALATRYASYLDGPEGRLRCQLLWSGLEPHLPPRGRRALDAGAGTGELTMRLAAHGLQVVALDASPAMLARIRLRSKTVERVVGDLADARVACGRRSFDLVACHLALEYTAEPRAALAALASCVKRGGVLSLVFRNAGGEMLKHAGAGDLDAAKRALETRTFAASVLGSAGVLLSERRVQSWLTRAGLGVIAAAGVRVLPVAIDADNFEAAAELERAASRTPALRGAARYIHLVARKERDV